MKIYRRLFRVSVLLMAVFAVMLGLSFWGVWIESRWIHITVLFGELSVDWTQAVPNTSLFAGAQRFGFMHMWILTETSFVAVGRSPGWELEWNLSLGSRSGSIELPLVLLVVAAGLPAAYCWYARWIASRRLAAGLCVACGYDLRSSVDRCPECQRQIDDRENA
jgi:hypothetical protein